MHWIQEIQITIDGNRNSSNHLLSLEERILSQRASLDMMEGTVEVRGSVEDSVTILSYVASILR